MVVAITGGARGIGLATAKRLAASGARIALGDIDEAALEDVKSQIPGTVLTCKLDVRDEQSFSDFLSAAVAEFGGLDVLVNNAGIMPVGPLLEESGDVARRMFDINVHGVLIGTKLAVPLLAGRPGARIVNMASYAGKLPVPGQVSYSATKAAVLAISEASRWEFESRGVGVTAIIPTFTNTELITGTGTPKGVVPIEPDDVAGAIAHAIEHGDDEVYVPKSLKPFGRALGVLPRRWRNAIHHRLGVDTAFMNLDRERRKAYLERTEAL
jgi:NADP-dependent 3-hydroxy acid dehydrogenase YdfG